MQAAHFATPCALRAQGSARLRLAAAAFGLRPPAWPLPTTPVEGVCGPPAEERERSLEEPVFVVLLLGTWKSSVSPSYSLSQGANTDIVSSKIPSKKSLCRPNTRSNRPLKSIRRVIPEITERALRDCEYQAIRALLLRV